MQGFSILCLLICALVPSMVLGRAEGEGEKSGRISILQKGRSLTQLRQDLYEDRIIDGEHADIKNYPFLASLRAGKGLFVGNKSIEGTHLCGGSLVAKNIVLTAAHCVNDALLRRPTVYFNITKVDSPHFQAFNVLETRIHPKYQESAGGSLDYDAALLVLDGEPSAQIVPIRYDDRCFRGGAKCAAAQVLGWGLTREDDPSSAASSLLKADLPLKSHRQCQQIFGDEFTDAMICAGGESKDACQGDSGGPLLIDDKLVGVVSWGFGCGVEGLPALYTNLAHLKTWLQKEFRDVLGRQPNPINRGKDCFYRYGVYVGAGCGYRGRR